MQFCLIIYKLKNETRIQVNNNWFIRLNLYAGDPQKTHHPYHQAPLGEFHETFLLRFLK